MSDIAVCNSVYPLVDTPVFPQGPLSVTAVLEQAGYQVEFYDYQLEPVDRPGCPDAFYEFLRRARANVIGISTLSSSLPTVLLAVRRLKDEAPHKTVVLGGPAATDTAEAILAHFPVDVSVRGEGEETAVQLMRALERGKGLEEVAGLTFRQDGTVVSTSPRPRIRDLDTLPYPAYHRVDFRRYTSALGIVYARGCPYRFP